MKTSPSPLLNPCAKGKEIFTDPSTNVSSHLGDSEGRPLGFPTAASSPSSKKIFFSFEPLLITSNSNPLHVGISSSVEQRSMLVSKMVDALSHGERSEDHAEEDMEEEVSDASDSLLEADDDMILCQYQKDVKLESLAKREPSRRGTKTKKG